jgi:hypothetical protein
VPDAVRVAAVEGVADVAARRVRLDRRQQRQLAGVPPPRVRDQRHPATRRVVVGALAGRDQPSPAEQPQRPVLGERLERQRARVGVAQAEGERLVAVRGDDQ